MPGFGVARPKLPLHLSVEQSTELKRLVQAPGTPQKIARRARIAYGMAARRRLARSARLCVTAAAERGSCPYLSAQRRA